MSPVDEEPAEARRGAQAVDRAVAVLNVFGPAVQPLALVDVARSTGLNVSTAHRLVRALVRGRLLEQDVRTERYQLGLGCVILGQSAARQFGLEHAEAELRSLAEEVGEAASLGNRDGHDVVVLARAESSQPLRFDRPSGSRIGLHASAMGKALLAFGPEDIAVTVAGLGELSRYTRATITTKRRLTADLAAARQRGWTINDEEQHVGVRAIGAPVLDRSGVARLAVAVQGPTARLDDRRREHVARLVVAAAGRLAASLPLDRFT